ncbi:5'-nucleotidase C-terminal domain-containing protein [Hydrogenibacillus sp. N12]|uniref:5'-nucleotidase C-terminal domain-containing protein n=1 Tax=Hydrogenibacillus sp. N12 TaxID=2866627 RepID=UPI001C7D2506|nr:5'-nucleotidase C-terminal domain-containing protein [Hydrogenibacillus sp. N12]QZA33284.1 5'-nucleotidase C-terminal domain-containing protein [Hydrogenibacillus sp. N12]
MFEKAPFRPRRRWWLSLLLVMALLGAADVPLFGAAQATAETAERVLVLYEGFEQGTKQSYAKDTVNLPTGPWELDDALLGTDARDKKIGNQSIRIQKSGSLTMNFDVTVTDVAYVELWHANAGFSGDVGGKWKLQYSIDQGQTWQDAGPEVPSGSTLEKASFEIHHTGPIRFKVQKTDGSTQTPPRINIDDFAVYTLPSAPPAEAVQQLQADPENVVLDLQEHRTGQLSLTAVFADGKTADVTPYATYASADPRIATVDAGGLITAVSPGQTVVQAVYGGLTARVDVTVREAPPAKDTSALHIIHTNDIHGKIQDFAKLARVIERTRAEHAYTLVIDDGDQFSGDAVTDLAKGKPMVELFNAVGLDAMAIGNHDFDYGPEIMMERRNASTYPWLAANVRVVDSGATPVAPPDPYVVIQIDEAGHKTVYRPGDAYDRDKPGVLTVGLLAITQAPPATAPKNVVGLAFDDYAETIERYLWLKDQVDVFILLSHVGYPDDQSLAERFPQFDLIIGGHSHTTLNKPSVVNGVPIVQTGAHLTHIGHTWLTIDPQTKRVTAVDGELIPVASLSEADPKIQAIVDRYTEAVQDVLKEQVGVTKNGLSQSGKNSGDVPLGNFWTDAMRFYLQDMHPDIAFMNAGGIRDDLKPGPITKGDLYRIEPFANQLTVIDLPGRALREILRYSYTREGRNSIDLQVSGMRYTIVTDALGNFKDVTMEIGGQPVDPDKVYRVVVPDYIGTGGSGYPFPALGEIRFTMVGLVTDALEQYARHLMATQGSVEAKKEGRIRIQRTGDVPDLPLLSIREARNVAEGTPVRVQGVVTTTPGAWGAKGFYLQDDTGGLYVYQSAFDVRRGDLVEVIGKTKNYFGEWEIDTPLDVRVLQTDQALPEAKTIRPDQVQEHQGELVRLADVLISELKPVNAYGTFEFKATDEAGRAVVVRVDNRTGLAYPDFTFRNGDRVDVVGVASVYNGVYQVKPRGAEDIAAPSLPAPEDRPFRILNPSLDRTDGLRATVTVGPASAFAGSAVVVFQLLERSGDAPEPAGIVALDQDAWSGEPETVHAYFNVSGKAYIVKIYVLDAFSSDPDRAPRPLADPVELP